MTHAQVIAAKALVDPRYRKFLGKEKAEKKPIGLPCIYRGAEPVGKVGCKTCKGNWQLNLLPCIIHGTCTLVKRVDGHGCCDAQCKERVLPI